MARSATSTIRSCELVTNDNLNAGGVYTQEWQDTLAEGLNFIAGSLYMDKTGVLSLHTTDDPSFPFLEAVVFDLNIVASVFTPIGPLFLSRRYYRWILRNTGAQATTSLILNQTLATGAGFAGSPTQPLYVLPGTADDPIHLFAGDSANPLHVVSDSPSAVGTVQLLRFAADGVAPHALAVRATYTVPAGKAATLEVGFVRMYRSAAVSPPSAVSTARALCRIVRGGLNYSFVSVDVTDKAVGGNGTHVTSDAGKLSAGDKVEIVTVDGSPSGAVDYDLMAKLTEYSL